MWLYSYILFAFLYFEWLFYILPFVIEAGFILLQVTFWALVSLTSLLLCSHKGWPLEEEGSVEVKRLPEHLDYTLIWAPIRDSMSEFTSDWGRVGPRLDPLIWGCSVVNSASKCHFSYFMERKKSILARVDKCAEGTLGGDRNTLKLHYDDRWTAVWID